MNQDFDNLLDLVSNYEEHLSKVYNMETFYGDTTLQNLLSHTKSLSEDIKSFVEMNKDIYIDDEQE